MATNTIEKLIVQIFDRKSQIIQQLNHQKQLYHQHLLSKLVLQGISPPSYLLNSDFCTSDLTQLNKEELISGLLLPRPKPLATYISGPCTLYDKPVVAAANSGIPDETCAVQCASNNGIDEDQLIVAPPVHVDGTEDTASTALLSHVDGTDKMSGIVPPCHVDNFVETSNYVPMSPEDQTNTRLPNAYKPEQSLGRIQRSRSRQKALELRNSGKANGKSRLGTEDDAGISSRTNICYDEQLDDLREPLQLAEPSALPSEICVHEVVAFENGSNKERSADACSDSLAQTTANKGKEVRSGDSEMKKNSVTYSGPFTSSRSCSQLPIEIPSRSKAYSCAEHHDGSSISLNLKETSRFPSEICSTEEALIGNCSDKEINYDACGASTYSTLCEGKEVDMGGSQKSEEFNNAFEGRIMRSRSSCQQYIGEARPVFINRNAVCISQMERSGSAETELAENDDLQNARCSSYCKQPINADHAFGNSKADSGKFTKSRSGEAEEDARNERSRSRKDVSVKPKQLDFDEVDDNNLADIHNCLSVPLTRYKSCSQQPNGIPSGSKTYSCDEHHDGSSISLNLEETSRFPSEICSKEEALIGNCSDKERNIDACGALTYSTPCEGKEVDMGGSQKSEEFNNVFGGRITRSRSSCQQYIGEACPVFINRNDVCISPMERSRSAETELAENDDLQNARCSSYCKQPIDADHAFGSSKADSGKFTKSRSGEVEEDARNERSSSRKDVSVKSKQLDFDEVDESNLADIHNCLSVPFTRSRSCSQQPIGISSGSKTYRCDEHHDWSSISLNLEETSRNPSEICFKEETLIEKCSDKERIIDACGASTYSTLCEGKEVDMGGSQKSEEFNNVFGGRITRSRSSCQQYIGEVRPVFINRADVCISPMERSRSAETELAENDDLQNARCSSYRKQPIDADHAFGNSKADSGKFTKSRSGEVEEDARNERSRSRKDVSVKSKQLDFDEVDESNLADIHNCLSVPISQGTSEDRNKVNLCENSKPLGFDEVERSKSLVAVTDFGPRVTGDKVESVQSIEMVELENLSNHNVIHDLSSKHGKCVGDSTQSEFGIEVNRLLDFSVSYAMDGSWPCYKRRKIEYQCHGKSASRTLRVNSCFAINKEAANRSSGHEKENILLMSQDLTNSHHSGALFSSCAKEIDQNVSSSPNKEHVSTPLMQCNKDEVSLGRTVMSSTCESRQLSEPDVSNVSQSIPAEPSKSLTEDFEETTNEPSAVFCDGRVSDGLLKDQDLVDVSSAMKLMDIHMDGDQRKFSHREDESKISIGSPLMEHMDVADADQTIPEFEGFVIGKNAADVAISTDELATEDISFLSSIMDRTSLPRKVYSSATLSTPVSPFPSACKVYLAPGIYSSVPNGLLESIDLQSNLLPSENALLGKFRSDSFPFPASRHGWDTRKPFLSPVGIGFEGITSKSGSSNKPCSTNLELSCFPIMEDPESSEEEVDDAVNTGVERADLTLKTSSNMEPDIDITMENVSSLAPNHAIERESSEPESSDVKEPPCDVTLQHQNSLALDPSVSRCSLASVSTEISIQKMHSNIKKSGMSQMRSRQTRPGKENKGFSVGADSIKKHAKTQSSRFSKLQLSAKSNLRSRGQSMSEKRLKPNNIVSNMRSFLPLVQQKQAAAVVPEKRDVKVKALQAAEAAKRVAEKRENERKQKKEAMKVERARVEQENMREKELKKKLKEEEKKRREAENAAKKRQREDEERQEKERKKKRIEDARLQHKQAEEKLHAWREETRCALEDERPHQKKDYNERTAKQVDRGDEGNDTGQLINNSVVVGDDKREADEGLATVIDHKMSVGDSASAKAGNIDSVENSTPNFDKNEKPFNRSNAQESYDISPYQCSDDEDEEEDEIPNKKFIPTWASKNSVALALSSMRQIDPEKIYPPGSFCSLDEVLLPRRLAQN